MAAPTIDIESTVPQAEDKWIRQSCQFYACPICKQSLEPAHDVLFCRVCVRTYPIVDGIPDFVVINLEQSSNRSLRAVGKMDFSALLNFLASVYESCVYPLVSNICGGWRSTSLKKLVEFVSGVVGSRDGVILDAACGPATYGRRVASTSKTVLGVDICMSMMRRGVHYVEKGHIPNVPRSSPSPSPTLQPLQPASFRAFPPMLAPSGSTCTASQRALASSHAP